MRLLLLLLGFVLLGGCVSSLASTAVTRPLRVPVLWAPPPPLAELRVRTADGLTLDGWVLEPRGATRGTVVLLHGKDINRTHFLGYAEGLRSDGYRLVAYDQRAHGRSEGSVVSYGCREVNDLQRVLDEAAVGPVAVIGESLGAAVALQAAAVEPRIRVVVAAAPFADLRTLLEQKAPFFMSGDQRRAAIQLAEEAMGCSVDALSPAAAAARIEVPTLVLHGSADRFIPIEHSLRVVAALKGPHRLVRLLGVGHVDVLTHEQVWRLIQEFIGDELVVPAAGWTRLRLRERG